MFGVVAEVMLVNSAVRNLIREGKTGQLRNVVATHQAEGMQTLESDLTQLVHHGVLSYETAVGASLFPKEVERPLVSGASFAPSVAVPSSAF